MGTNRQRRRAWSLPELVTVMAVTSILAGAFWQVGIKAVTVANKTRTTWELRNLNDAVEDFCQQFGDYPPDFHDPVAAHRFLVSHFPKCSPKFFPNVLEQSPATALYFWLGGPKGNGFSANPVNPFDDGPRRIGPFIKFAKERLRTVGGGTQYLPPGGAGQPYVYFHGGLHGYRDNNGWCSAHPYRSSVDNSWINPHTFQILSAGEDGQFGGGSHYPAGGDYEQANLDDMANFSSGSTLGNAMSETATHAQTPATNAGRKSHAK
ncbi:MAG: hypothetical protein ABFC63_10920 [Thermoguttaceae bacterium]